MKLSRKVGAVSQIMQIFLQDSTNTAGGGLTGLTNTAAGLTCYYIRDTDTAATSMSLVTMTIGTFSSSGFRQIDATNMPGCYQVCPPNAAFTAGASSCIIMLKGATNLAPLVMEIDLDSQVDVTHISGAVVNTTVAQVGVNLVSVSGVANNVTVAQVGVNIVNIKGTPSSGAAGYMALDFSAITNTASTQSFTNMTISPTQKVDVDTIKTNPVVNGGTVTFPTNSTLASTVNITAGTITTATNVTTVNGLAANVITAASIAAAALNGKGDWATVNPTNLTAAQIATGVWQDTTAGDFTTAGSIGKSLFTSGNAPGASSGLALVGSNMGSVTAIGAGGITNTSFAASAIDAAALATDAVAEIAAGLLGTALAEIATDPGATPTLSRAIMLPYMGIRNARVTDSGAGTDTIANNAGSVILTAAISDAANVFTKAKYA